MKREHSIINLVLSLTSFVISIIVCLYSFDTEKKINEIETKIRDHQEILTDSEGNKYLVKYMEEVNDTLNRELIHSAFVINEKK